jgi:ribosomal protein S18 acetylase RimI-like enzyme
MSPPRVRRAVPADAPAIALVHVEAWRETYRGIMPDAVLAALSAGDRERGWRASLESARADIATFVAPDPDGAVVGFASCGPWREPAIGVTSEIYAIYVLGTAQRSGRGRALMAAAAGFLAERGVVSTGLWVARDNAVARAFYAALGGVELAAREIREPEFTLPEIGYGWRDLAPLRAAARVAC